MNELTNTQQSLAEFIAANGLSMTCEWAESNPTMEQDSWARDATHYLVTIRGADGEKMSLHYSMGAAHTDEPSLEMVLDSLASDAASVANAPDWLDWAEEMGYEGAQSLRAARTAHETIVKQAAELEWIVGDEAYETLLWNIERS